MFPVNPITGEKPENLCFDYYSEGHFTPGRLYADDIFAGRIYTTGNGNYNKYQFQPDGPTILPLGINHPVCIEPFEPEKPVGKGYVGMSRGFSDTDLNADDPISPIYLNPQKFFVQINYRQGHVPLKELAVIVNPLVPGSIKCVGTPSYWQVPKYPYILDNVSLPHDTIPATPTTLKKVKVCTGTDLMLLPLPNTPVAQEPISDNYRCEYRYSYEPSGNYAGPPFTDKLLSGGLTPTEVVHFYTDKTGIYRFWVTITGPLPDNTRIYQSDIDAVEFVESLQ